MVAIAGVEGSVLLLDIAIVILSATIMAAIARLLKQPLIVAYVVAGIIIGPVGLGLIEQKEVINVLAELGIALLLFMVGLELDIGKLKDVGQVSLKTAIGQIIFTFIIGYILATQLLGGYPGYVPLWAFYVAFALTISSTMVIIKLLSDRNEIDTLHGKIVLGTLLVQDIVSIIVLAALPSLTSFQPLDLVDPVLYGVALVSIALVSGRYVAPPILKQVAKSTELLFLTALSWCLIFSFLSLRMGFHTVTIGAFLGGIALAIFPYNLEIIGRVRSLRDFFATIFFVSLGMQMVFEMQLLILGVIFSLFVLIGNGLIAMLINLVSGFRKRTAFLTGISLAQISEFSLIIVKQGNLLGHVPDFILSLVTFIAILTITASTYFIIHGRELYRRIVPILSFFENVPQVDNKELEQLPTKSEDHIILCGCDRMGRIILETIKNMRKHYLVVDINPEVVKKLIEEGVPCIYGDIGDQEILDRIDLYDAEIIISTVPDLEDNQLLIKEARDANPDSLIFILEPHVDSALELYKQGADYVIIPDILGGEMVSEYVADYMLNPETIQEKRKHHIRELERIKKEEQLSSYEYALLKQLETEYEDEDPNLKD